MSYIHQYSELERKTYNKAKNETKMKCPCGGNFTLENKNKHSETKKHLKYVESSHTNQEYIDNVLMKNCKIRE